MVQILPNATYGQLNKALANVVELRLIVEKVERCGSPCQEMHDQLDEWDNYLNAMKREFFPDKP